MSMSTLVILGVNLLAGIGFIWYLRSLDKYEKESVLTISLLVVFGGISSILLCLAGYFLTGVIGISNAPLFVRSFIEIGPVEELAKLIPFIVFEKLFRNKVDEPIDGVIYIASIALGFALIENHFYALKDTSLIFIRSGLTSPMHISFSAIMGFTYVYNKNTSRSYQRMFKAFLIAAFLHGAYDAMVFAGFFSYWVFFCIIFFGMRIVNYSLWNSPFRQKLVAQAVEAKNIENDFCITCSINTDQKKIRIEKMSLGLCETCGMVALKEKELYKVMNYFAPGLLKEVRGSDSDSDLEKGYRLIVKDKADKNHNNFKIFNLNDFSNFLDESIVKLNNKFQRGKTYRFLFGDPLRGVTSCYQNLSKDQITSEAKEAVNKVRKSQEFKSFFVLIVAFAGIIVFTGLIFAAVYFLEK